MQEQRKLRKRIPLKKVTEQVILHDPLAYITNKASVQARKAAEHEELIHIEIWFDKHYYSRYQHGDESGKRKGIDPYLVKEIVIQSISWLTTCSGRFKFFSFLNYEKEMNSHRIVLQKNTEEGLWKITNRERWCSCNFFLMIRKGGLFLLGKRIDKAGEKAGQANYTWQAF